MSHSLAAAIRMAHSDHTAIELHAQRAFDAASRHVYALSHSVLLLALVRGHLAAGRSEEAARTADRIRKLGFRRDRGRDHDEAETTVQAYLANGEVERARDTARRWLESTDARGLARLDGLLALTRAELAAGAPDGGDAIRALLDQASQLVSEFDIRILEPRVHERRAEFAAIEGDAALRRDQLERARVLYRDMGAHFHAERLERELAS